MQLFSPPIGAEQKAALRDAARIEHLFELLHQPQALQPLLPPIHNVTTMSLHTTLTAAMPTTAAPQPPRRDSLNLRITPTERNLIDRAAASQGTTRTEFILRAARQAAEETLLERALITTHPEAYAEFLQRLDAPARPNERLTRTLQTPFPWATPASDTPAV